MKVIFIAPIYFYYPIIIPSLILQTHKDWHLILIHDGPNNENLNKIVESFSDKRITYIETPERQGKWGHFIRDYALQKIEKENIAGDFIVITNADNYYVPGFVEIMLSKVTPKIIAVYCDMIHSHKKWDIIRSLLKKSNIDCGNFMCRRDVSLKIGWKDYCFSADWLYIQKIVQAYGPGFFAKVSLPLFIHN